MADRPTFGPRNSKKWHVDNPDTPVPAFLDDQSATWAVRILASYRKQIFSVCIVSHAKINEKPTKIFCKPKNSSEANKGPTRKSAKNQREFVPPTKKLNEFFFSKQNISKNSSEATKGSARKPTKILLQTKKFKRSKREFHTKINAKPTAICYTNEKIKRIFFFSKTKIFNLIRPTTKTRK